jgi:hypothetical protein
MGIRLSWVMPKRREPSAFLAALRKRMIHELAF